MKVWRLARTQWAPDVATILSGEGASRRGGRWSPAGMRAVYCCETSSLALLEILVGLPFGVDHPAYRIVDLTVPDGSIAHLEVSGSAQPPWIATWRSPFPVSSTRWSATS
ncbi:MAG: RES family NAD+ phosphorylase [Acidobacteria bacterium]|nr:RES family NAD+ phosphorylase [Acidobacteriota bacterium]